MSSLHRDKRMRGLFLRAIVSTALLGAGCSRTASQLNIDNQIDRLEVNDLALKVCTCTVSDCADCDVRIPTHGFDASDALQNRGRGLLQIVFDVDPPPSFVRVSLCDRARGERQGFVYAFTDSAAPAITVVLRRDAVTGRFSIGSLVPAVSVPGTEACTRS